MININNKQLCENCFAQIKSEPCPVCGFSKSGYFPQFGVMPAGSILMGKYIIGQIIGQGGFGITYRAYDIKRKEIIAIKEYYPGTLSVRETDGLTVTPTTADNAEIFQSGIEKFYEEASLLSQFNDNPGIVSVYEFFYENNTAYFAMEYLEGLSLKNYVEQNGVISPENALYVLEKMTDALTAAHSANILHRDISPDNIMLCNDGRIKLIDFGAARQVIADNPKSMSVILKQGFAPLEQYQKRGNQGPWTDIYSLGASIYYLLTKDYLDDPMSRLDYDDDFSTNKYDIEGQLWQVIERCVRLKIAERYQSARELKEDVRKIHYAPVPFFSARGKKPEFVPPAEEIPQAAPLTPVEDISAAEEVPSTVAMPPAGDVPPTVAMQTAGGVPPVYDDGPIFRDAPDMYDHMPDISKKRKKPKAKVFIIVGCAVLAIIGIIIGIVVVTSNNKSNSSSGSWGFAESDSDSGDNSSAMIKIGSESYSADEEELDLTGKRLRNRDIEGLKDFKNLKILLMNDNNVSDLSVLAQMPQLEGVWFNNNNVRDISFASELKNLKYISFTGNKVSDLSPLQGTTKLEHFWGNDNPFNDINPLRENRGMLQMGLSRCPIDGDIGAVSGMTELTFFAAESCGITDLYSLRACRKLEYAYLGNNSINDVSPLANCNGIKELWISDNSVYDSDKYISSFAGITIVDNGNISVESSDGTNYFVFRSEAEAKRWADTMNLGGGVNCYYTYIIQ